MFRACRIMLAAAVVAVTASPAMAQFGGFGGGGGLTGLVTQESVQKELKLTPDQVTKARAIQEKQQQAMMSVFQDFQNLSQEERQAKMKEVQTMNQANEKALLALLKPDQVKRLKQISLQQQGVSALGVAPDFGGRGGGRRGGLGGQQGDPEAIKAVNLTEDQKNKIREVMTETFTAAQGDIQGAFQGGNMEEGMKLIQGIQKKVNDKVVSTVFTPDQKKKWQELTGPEFKGEIRVQFPGRGGP